MKGLIKKLLREGLNINEARYDQSNLSQDIGLFVINNGNTIVLYDMAEYDDSERIRGIKGTITISNNGNNFSADKVAANKGYGPLMFELAMQHVYPKGIIPDRDGDIREGALSVLDKFVNNSNGEVEVITLVPGDEGYVDCLDFGCDDNEPEFFKVYNSILKMSNKSLYKNLKAEGKEFIGDVGKEFLKELSSLSHEYFSMMYSQS